MYYHFRGWLQRIVFLVFLVLPHLIQSTNGCSVYRLLQLQHSWTRFASLRNSVRYFWRNKFSESSQVDGLNDAADVARVAQGSDNSWRSRVASWHVARCKWKALRWYHGVFRCAGEARARSSQFAGFYQSDVTQLSESGMSFVNKCDATTQSDFSGA